MTLLSIILPTYNESQGIIKLINTVHKVCKNISHEIIIVDDDSPDGTAATIARQFRSTSWVRNFIHPGKRDLGLSILYGIKQSRGHIIIGMDADGNHDPGVIPHLLKSLKTADLVVASRFIPQGGTWSPQGGTWSRLGGMTPIRFWASFLFNKTLQTFLGFPITDNTSGFYAIRKKRLLALKPSSIYYGYGEYHLRLVWYATIQGLTMTEVPVYYGRRLSGMSKSRLVPMALSYLKTAVRLKYFQ